MAKDEELTILPLGAACEVGRSCFLLRYAGKSVLLDCGTHPSYKGTDSLPFLDFLDPSTLDAVFITHFHVDHCAGLPFLLSETQCEAPVYMTHPTRVVYEYTIEDSIRLARHQHTDENLTCTAEQLAKSLQAIRTVHFRQTVEINGIRATAFSAGHVIGAAMWLIEIAGRRVLYTGDFSLEVDRHLPGADLNSLPAGIDVVMTESTYGGQEVHGAEAAREEKMLKFVSRIVGRGGRCLMPVFAIGRVQEILLILEEHWSKHPELHSVPIYYLATKRTVRLFKSFTHFLSSGFQERARRGDHPFEFSHVRQEAPDFALDLASRGGPLVVVASPGMLQSGNSRHLFEEWQGDRSSGVLLTGYTVSGTPAHDLRLGQKVMTTDGTKVKPQCDVGYVSFSAHSDVEQTRRFLSHVRPQHVVLIHGQKDNVEGLATELRENASAWGMTVYKPELTEEVRIPLEPVQAVSLCGEVASKASEGGIVSGFITQGDRGLEAASHVGALATSTQDLHVAWVHQTVAFNVSNAVERVAKHFGARAVPATEKEIERFAAHLVVDAESVRAVVVDGQVAVANVGNKANVFHFKSAQAEILFDEVAECILDPAPRSERIGTPLECVCALLATGGHQAIMEGDVLKVTLDGEVATVDSDFEVSCSNEEMREDLQSVIDGFRHVF